MQQNFKLILLLPILLVLLATHCEEIPDPEEKIVFVDSNLYSNGKSDSFQISDIEIVDDSLSITLQYSGGCIEPSLQLVGEGFYPEIKPPQCNLRLLFDNKDNCETWVTRSFAFYLGHLKRTDSQSIVFNLKDWENPIHYEY